MKSNVWWCQGYSEPGSGSDLASLKTKADFAGDHYVVNGTKTWTTLGQHADWIFVLARTTTDVARRQEGISFLLADMDTPGLTVKPIITIEGDHEVNEVHFENVRVPAENLVGRYICPGGFAPQDLAANQMAVQPLRSTKNLRTFGHEPFPG